MAFKTVNSFIDCGTDWNLQVTLKGIDNIPLNLMEMQFRGMARYTMDPDIQAVINCRVPRNIDGVLELSISSRTTSMMPPGTWVYDVEMTMDSGIRHRLLDGKLIVTGEVTIID